MARAQDEAASIAQAEKAAPSKAERLRRNEEKLVNDRLTQERAQKDVEAKSGANSAASFATKAPKRVAVKSDEEKVVEKKKAAVAAVATPTAVPGKNKVIFSPADDLDEDELNPVRPGQGLLLAAYLLSLPTIYLFFWVAGSLNII